MTQDLYCNGRREQMRRPAGFPETDGANRMTFRPQGQKGEAAVT